MQLRESTVRHAVRKLCKQFEKEGREVSQLLSRADYQLEKKSIDDRLFRIGTRVRDF